MKRITLFITLIIFSALVACSPKTAAELASGTLAATAQEDQYLRDAQATQDARDATIAANAASLRATADALTQQADVATQAYNATNTAATSTEARRLEVEPTQTAAYWATDAMQRAQQADATRVMGVKLTETEAFSRTSATQTATVVFGNTELQRQRAEADLLRDKAFMVLAVLAVSGLVIWLFGYQRAHVTGTQNKNAVVATGPNGINPLVVTNKHGRTSIINLMNSPSPSMVIDSNGNVIPTIGYSAEDQARAHLESLKVIFEQAGFAWPYAPATETTHTRRLGPLDLSDTQKVGGTDIHISKPTPPALRAAPNVPQLPAPSLSVALPTAQWRDVVTWPHASFLLGVGAEGHIAVDPEQYPNFLIAGSTGSGKTLGCLRPLVAQALMRGWQVIAFDQGRPGLHSFFEHPNFMRQMILEPATALTLLEAIWHRVDFLNKRIAAKNGYTWRDLGADAPPQTLVVFDEFSNWSDRASTEERKEGWRFGRMIAAECRKVGIHFALALQDASRTGVDIRLRRNSLSICFRVTDLRSSELVLGGGSATGLPIGQFLTVTDGLKHGNAFNPSDADIAAALAARPVQPLPAPEWLTVTPTVVSDEAASVDDGETLVNAPQVKVEDDEAKVQQMLALQAEGKSISAIAKAMYGYDAGKAWHLVKNTLAALNSSPTTPTSLPQNHPVGA